MAFSFDPPVLYLILRDQPIMHYAQQFLNCRLCIVLSSTRSLYFIMCHYRAKLNTILATQGTHALDSLLNRTVQINNYYAPYFTSFTFLFSHVKDAMAYVLTFISDDIEKSNKIPPRVEPRTLK